jgi:hypothetical protein
MRLFGIGSDIGLINHQNNNPIYTKFVSWPKDHFKAIQKCCDKKQEIDQTLVRGGGVPPLWSNTKLFFFFLKASLRLTKIWILKSRE